MNTLVRFFFDVGSEVDSSVSFSLLNPPVLPQEGKIVEADWKYYIKNEKAVKAIEEIHEGHCLIANILSINYYSDKVEMVVVLFQDVYYEKNFAGKK